MKKMIIDVRMNEYAMRDDNPNVPWSPAEIAEDAAECYEAGATCVHFHGRDGVTGEPENSFETYAETIERIREKAPDVLVHSTLGYVTLTPSERRVEHILKLARNPKTRPDIAPVDMASMNVDVYAKDRKEFVTDDLVFHNSDGDHQMLQWTAAGLGPRLMAILHHTDAIREWAYDRTSQIGRLDKALDEANDRGWTVIDMRRDWKWVFPFQRRAP